MTFSIGLNLLGPPSGRKLEDALDQKMAELISLRKAAVEHAAGSPVKSAPLQSALGAWGDGGPGRWVPET